ncbi:thermonuclease family protein [Egicoccus sp. AB-alg6-2]|uniref:thermonuclease family protein n=1 Tax=Egicoccus sp. AB-alg6-2 TaxID=3242692 RepID=UPI00359DA258
MRDTLSAVLAFLAVMGVLLSACLPPAGRDATVTEPGWTVVHVVDGDTVDVRAADGTEERIRVIGIDTPERGECGYVEAAAAMADLVDGRQVDLVAGARDDRDRYDRLLRYLDVDGTDAGLRLIERGLAIARYDSRDGHGRHDREDAYVAADRVDGPVPCNQ